METILIRERYKVVRAIYMSKDYMLAEAVDIQERETPLCLINLYEGPLLHRYGKIYTQMTNGKEHPSFRRILMDGGTLAAIFDSVDGVPIDRLFYRGDRWNWRERLDLAELLLHQALLLSDLPPEVGCAAMLSDNVLIDLKEHKIRIRFMVPPLTDMNKRELALLAGDQVKKILPRKLSNVPSESAFLDRVDRGAHASIVALYADWRSVQDTIRSEYEAWEKRGIIRRGFTLLKRLLRRKKRDKR